MFKGIRFKTFLSTPEEWHALVIGLFEVIAPWPPRQATIDAQLLNSVWTEYHYYEFGRALGIFAWLGIAKLIKELFFV